MVINFNPHEREARDVGAPSWPMSYNILIHTSVKLVTGLINLIELGFTILIHTSVKLVTQYLLQMVQVP